jgi:hypothetical protein
MEAADEKGTNAGRPDRSDNRTDLDDRCGLV